MAEQEIKQNSQKQQETGKQNPLERKDAAPGAESKEIMSKMRDSEKVQTVTRNNQISTLVNTALASGTVTTGNNNSGFITI